MKCTDPNCVVCAYRERFPDEKRFMAITELYRLMAALMCTVDDSRRQVEAIEPILTLVSGDAAHAEKESTRLFNELVQSSFAGNLVDIGSAAYVGMTLLIATVPEDVRQAALELFYHECDRVASAHPESNDTSQIIKNGMAELIDNFRRMGEDYLAGRTMPIKDALENAVFTHAGSPSIN